MFKHSNNKTYTLLLLLVSSVGAILQYYHHYAILGYAIYGIATIFNIACAVYSSIFPHTTAKKVIF